MSVTVIVNDYQLSGTDLNGVKWHVREVAGWDAFEVRTEILTAPGVTGGFPGEWVEDSLPIAVAGVFEAPSTSVLTDTITDLLAAMKILNTDVEMSVQRGADIQQRMVRSAGRPLIRILTDRAAEFEVQLIALDPAFL